MDLRRILIASTLSLLVVKGEPPSPQYGAPFNNNNGINNAPISSYGTPNYNVNNDQQSHDHSEPKSYEFGYQVKDDYTGNNYGRQERSDGNQITGEYRVQLPDGRMQIVTYYADWLTGYHADVRYEGQAQYPDQYGQPPKIQHSPPGPNNQYGPPQTVQYSPPGPDNQYGPPPTIQHSPPNDGRFTVGQDNANPGYNYNAEARSSVSIKDFSGGSGGSNNYNSEYNYNNGINDGVNFDNNYDNFGSRNRVSPAYGAP